MTKKRSDIDRSAVFEAILGDLGSSEGEATAGSTVPLSAVRFNQRQPRKHVSEEGLQDLAASIRDKGVLEPIIVRRAGSGYELVAGERRTRAAKLAGLKEIPAIVVDIDDREALEIAIIENLQREDLNAVEETEAVIGLLEISLDMESPKVIALLHSLYNEERGRVGARDVSERHRGLVAALFRRLGRFSVSSFVSNRLPILDFPETLLSAVRTGKMAFTKAQAIARVADPMDRDRLLAVALAEDLSLSQIRRRITELRRTGTGPASARATPSSGALDAAQRLVTSTKKLLNRRRLAVLEPERLRRVNELLEQLQTALLDE
jgi:ParB family chromosome partitioning protein